jgi:hypothetical protein
MSVRNAIALFLALSTLALLAGCGSSSPVAKAPPSGGFTPSDLNGTYVFSTSGVDVNGEFLTIAGTVAANGSSGITGGTVDLIGLDFLSPTPVAQPVTSGTYSVSADGRGEIHFTTTTLNAEDAPTPITIVLDFALTTGSHGVVTEFDGNGTGSGTIDLQTAVSQSQLAGSYAFGVSGAGSTSSFAIVGSLTMNSDGSGNVTGGVEDINNGGSYLGEGTITNASSVTVGTGSGPGTAVIASNDGTYSFDVYAIDSTHLKLIENDGQLLLSGDAYTQGTSIPSGQLVYTMAGVDVSEESPFAAGGWLTNTSGAITAGVEDYNDGGNAGLDLSITSGSFSTLSGGRSQLTLNGFVNAAANDVPEDYTFAAYPFTYSGGTGVQLLEIDSLGVTSGTAYPQSSTTLATPPQGYAFNLSGFNPNGEEDDIAEFVTSSSSFSGIVDLNNSGTGPAPDQALGGSFSAPDANGRGSGTTTNYIGGFNFYVVNPTTYILLETDSGQVALGTFEQQGSPTPGAAQGVASMLRAPVRPHPELKKRK